MKRTAKTLVAVGIAALAAGAMLTSCIVPPPPPGRVIIAPHHVRVGYYVYGRHGRRYFVARPWARPHVGVYMEYLPAGYTIVRIGGVPYYYFDGGYYRPSGAGYVVVPQPEQNAAPAEQQPPAGAPQATEQPSAPPVSGEEGRSLSGAQATDTVTVSVPNAKGGYTAVKLVKRGGGYVGPQGEFYSGHPTVDQLKALYGN